MAMLPEVKVWAKHSFRELFPEPGARADLRKAGLIMSQNGLTWAWETHSKQQTTEKNGKISSEISTVPPRIEKELRDKKKKNYHTLSKLASDTLMQLRFNIRVSARYHTCIYFSVFTLLKAVTTLTFTFCTHVQIIE